MNSLPKYLASTTVTAASWHPTTVLSANTAAAIAKLKAGPTGRFKSTSPNHASYTGAADVPSS